MMAETQDRLIQTVQDAPAEVAVPTDLPGDWHVAHTRARNEKVLVVELSRMGIFNYLPLAQRETRSPRTGRISRSLVPVFPGYVFFHGSEEQRYRALRTNRIARVLVVLDQKQLITELRRVHAVITHTPEFFVANRIEVGEWGRVIAGPLRGLEGVVVRKSGRWRLSINVTILGQSVHVEVDNKNVERIEPPEYALADGRWPPRGRSERPPRTS